MWKNHVRRGFRGINYRRRPDLAADTFIHCPPIRTSGAISAVFCPLFGISENLSNQNKMFGPKNSSMPGNIKAGKCLKD